MPVASVDLPPAAKPPRVWKFWGTLLWGIFAFVAMFVGQLTAVGYEVLVTGAPIDGALIIRAMSSGTTVGISVIMGLVFICLALWLPIRLARQSFADYLALRGTSWKSFVIGTLALVALVGFWEVVQKLAGREASPDLMLGMLKSARTDGTLWLLVIAFCVAAPISEEFLARGFLFRGWSESFLRPAGAIALSSLAWTAMHSQYYEVLLFSQIFSIGLLLGYMRYRSNSIWLTIFLHGLNNLAATVQTLLIASGIMSAS
jgi:membrane protease YdiL (CAAX protease family)